MKTMTTTGLLASILMLSPVPGSVAVAEDLDLADTAEAIRQGDIDVGEDYGMHKSHGRFHRIHSETLGLECEACHVGSQYAPDYLLLDRANAERKAAGDGKGKKAGVLDRAVCLGCHKTDGVATPWYRTAIK